MQKDQWHKLSGLTMFVALPLALQVACAPVFAAHPRVAKNFFLEPDPGSQPCFTGTQLSQAEVENRRIPDIRLLRSLPSLGSESRKQIDRLYKRWQQDTAELRNAIQSVQQAITKLNDRAAMSSDAVAVSPVGKVTEPEELNVSASAGVSAKPEVRPEVSSSMATETAIIRSTDDTSISNSQNLPKKDSKVEDGSLKSAELELRKEQKKLRSELLDKRKELWNAIRPLLTEQNLADLEKMRHGQYIPASITATEGK